ncbi:hypothetical protein R1sor_006205 [Riccia sorocarpa]|uniref:Uncharacterized protein n=1 Tax=Riccia sorocarpa TaxID=122646 RepID=A0ABD3HT87_9MARC
MGVLKGILHSISHMRVCSEAGYQFEGERREKHSWVCMAADDVEMAELTEDALEFASLIPLTAREKSAALARAAYRAEIASHRAILLALLIVPIIVMIVLWQIFDSNSNWGFEKRHPAREVIPRPYRGSLVLDRMSIGEGLSISAG